MAKKISPEIKNVLLEGLKVFVWAGVSAIVPLVVAYMENDPSYVALVPVINALAYMVKTEMKNRGMVK